MLFCVQYRKSVINNNSKLLVVRLVFLQQENCVFCYHRNCSVALRYRTNSDMAWENLDLGCCSRQLLWQLTSGGGEGELPKPKSNPSMKRWVSSIWRWSSTWARTSAKWRMRQRRRFHIKSRNNNFFTVQGRAKMFLLSSVTHVPSGLIGCASAAVC